jgi:hypothetical protein
MFRPFPPDPCRLKKPLILQARLVQQGFRPIPQRPTKPIGTPNSILGRSIIACGTCRYSTRRNAHLVCPSRNFIDCGKRQANWLVLQRDMAFCAL